MNLDFHTKYTEKGFNGLCEKAIAFGLNGLVMTGLPDNVQREYKQIKIFPAQELDWLGALELETYNSQEDWERGKNKRNITHVLRGKILVLIPNEVRYSPEDKRLYNLLESIHNQGCAAIALHDDTNWTITGVGNDFKPVYPFNAIRIRPFKPYDIYSILSIARENSVAVAGSGAEDSSGIKSGTAYTFYENPILSQDELIQALRVRKRTSLRVFTDKPRRFIDIEKTVPKQGMYRTPLN